MTPLFRKFLGIHWILFLSMVLLLSFGILAIYSAVHFRQDELYFLHDEWRRQMNWALGASWFALSPA
jgi:rod shape determining protein RodA